MNQRSHLLVAVVMLAALASFAAPPDEVYRLGPDSLPQEGAPTQTHSHFLAGWLE
jgi:hypothetical protein